MAYKYVKGRESGLVAVDEPLIRVRKPQDHVFYEGDDFEFDGVTSSGERRYLVVREGKTSDRIVNSIDYILINPDNTAAGYEIGLNGQSIGIPRRIWSSIKDVTDKSGSKSKI